MRCNSIGNIWWICEREFEFYPGRKYTLEKKLKTLNVTKSQIKIIIVIVNKKYNINTSPFLFIFNQVNPQFSDKIINEEMK